MWERAGRLQDACDGSYFNGLPLFTGEKKNVSPRELLGCIVLGGAQEMRRTPLRILISDVPIKLLVRNTEIIALAS